MVLLGAELVATSAPDKTMTLIPELTAWEIIGIDFK